MTTVTIHVTHPGAHAIQWLTAARTAAGSALASALAVRGREDDKRHLVVFGAGFQAEAHLFCMLPHCEEHGDEFKGLGITDVTIINRSLGGIDALVRKFEHGYGVKFNAGVLLSDDAAVRRAVGAADVICTTTGSRLPLFDGGWMKPGCHVNCVGSYRTDTAEVDASTISRCSEIIVDSFAAVTTSGDLSSVATQYEKHAGGAAASGEMMCVGENASGSFRIITLGSALGGDSEFQFRGGEGRRDCSLFKSVGTAVQDIATAAAVLSRARSLGDVGSSVHI